MSEKPPFTFLDKEEEKLWTETALSSGLDTADYFILARRSRMKSERTDCQSYYDLLTAAENGFLAIKNYGESKPFADLLIDHGFPITLLELKSH
jgi:hypothetical protein